MNFNASKIEQALSILGELLADQNLRYEAVVIGGGSLLLLNQIDRTTKDLDVVALIVANEFVSADPLPLPLQHSIKEVGKALELGENWLNSGPGSLLATGLPDGFKSRMQSRSYGGLTIHLAGRMDQICFKLYASVDQGPESKHFADLKFLKPAYEELSIAKSWCLTPDVSEVFAAHVNFVVEALLERYGSS